jgi:hypothetical protein
MDVAAVRKENAVDVVRAEEIVMLGGIFPGFRGVAAAPAFAGFVEPMWATRRLYCLRNEVKTGAKRPAMERNLRCCLQGMLLLAVSGVTICVPVSLRAQEKGAQQPESPKSDSPKPCSSADFDLSNSGNKKETPPVNEHRFWNKENDWLFAGVGASRALDYFSTLNMRRRGRQEIFLTNDAVDNHAAFAAIEASGTGVSIGAAYLSHRYGHHKLERWTSIVHIGLATTGSVRNYCLKTAHFAKAPGAP